MSERALECFVCFEPRSVHTRTPRSVHTRTCIYLVLFQNLTSWFWEPGERPSAAIPNFWAIRAGILYFESRSIYWYTSHQYIWCLVQFLTSSSGEPREDSRIICTTTIIFERTTGRNYYRYVELRGVRTYVRTYVRIYVQYIPSKATAVAGIYGPFFF